MTEQARRLDPTVGVPPPPVPNISKYIAAAIRPSEGVSVEVSLGNPHSIYSLAIPEPGKFKPTYDVIMGKITHPHNWTNTIFGPSGNTYTGMEETQIGTRVSVLEHQDDFSPDERLLIPTGLKMLQKGHSVCGVVETSNPIGPQDVVGYQKKDYRIGIYARPLPDLSSEERADLLVEYQTKRDEVTKKSLALGIAGLQARAMEPDREKHYTFRADSDMDPSTADGHFRTYSLDARLLHPEIVAMNPSSPSFETLCSMYPTRIRALKEGFVSVDSLFFEPFPAYKLDPELAENADFYGGVLLPELQTLYKIIQMERAGFDVILAEQQDYGSTITPDQSSKRIFAVMIRPKKAAEKA